MPRTATFALALALVSSAHASELPAAITALHGYVGTWSCQGAFANGKKIASTIRFSTDLGGAVLVKHHDDSPQTGSYHALETWSYDAGKHQLVATVADNFGGVRIFDATPSSEQILQWDLQASDQARQQFVYTRIDAGHFRLDWNIERPGKDLILGDSLTCSRLTG
jgi:hypothetical protein